MEQIQNFGMSIITFSSRYTPSEIMREVTLDGTVTMMLITFGIAFAAPPLFAKPSLISRPYLSFSGSVYHLYLTTL